jgi:hypothetical protein
MAERISELAFNREAAEVTRRLVLARGYLTPDEARAGWSLWSCRNRYAKPVGRIAAPLVREMQARGVLKERPGGGLMVAQGGTNAVLLEVLGPGGRPVTAAVNETECPLGWLRWRKNRDGRPLVGEEQFAAAEKLRTDYTLAQFEQRITIDWDAPLSRLACSWQSTDLRISRAAIAARERLFAALDHVGPELSGILLEVCCMAGGIENAERLLGLPRRSGKAILEIALTRLARHYGLLPDDAPRASPPRHWAAPDSRPRII